MSKTFSAFSVYLKKNKTDFNIKIFGLDKLLKVLHNNYPLDVVSSTIIRYQSIKNYLQILSKMGGLFSKQIKTDNHRTFHYSADRGMKNSKKIIILEKLKFNFY